MPRADLRTPSNKDFGKPGVSFPWGNKDYPTVVEPHTENRNATRKVYLSAYDGAGSNYTGALLTGISVSEGDSATVVVNYKWETLPGPELIRKGYDLDSGAMTRVVRQKVKRPLADATPQPYPTDNGASRTFTINNSGGTATFYAQDSDIQPIDDITAWLTTTYMVLPTAVLTVYDQDEETLVNVRTDYQVVALSSITPPTPTTGIIITYKKIDNQKALKITRDFTDFLDFTYQEQRFSADTFPALFDYTSYYNSDLCGPFANIRSSFSAKTQTRITITYDDAVQAVAGLTLIPITLQIGRGVQIGSNVLVDAGSFTFVGTCTGTATWDASSPDYTTYLDTIQNTFQIVAGESSLWKAGIFKSLSVEQYML